MASAFGTMAALLLLVWLVRGILSISQFSKDILLSSFALIFLSRAFSTRTRSGAGRAVSSFLWNIAIGCVIVVILIWFLGWVASVQKPVLSSVFSSSVPELVIVAIATGLLAYAVRELTPRAYDGKHFAFDDWRLGVKKGGGLRAGGPAITVRANSEVKAGKTTLSAKADTVALPMVRSGRTVGCILFGDIKASFETPMGPVSAPFLGPVTTFGIPFRGDKAGKEEVSKIDSEKVEQLIRGAQTDPATSKLNGGGHSVDLPFVHVRDDWFGESVDVGPISVRRGPEGERVKIGSFEFNSDDDEDRRASWLARGGQDSTLLRVSEEGVSSRWNGSSLWMKGDSMRLTTGADGFFYSPVEVRTFSPLHTLHVANHKMTLDTRKFTLDVTEEKVVLRAESGSRSTDSPALAQDLRTLFTEEAKKHIQDVMKGVPIDVDEMLSTTEEALKKYD
jgi:hypothetical protein